MQARFFFANKVCFPALIVVPCFVSPGLGFVVNCLCIPVAVFGLCLVADNEAVAVAFADGRSARQAWLCSLVLLPLADAWAEIVQVDSFQAFVGFGLMVAD